MAQEQFAGPEYFTEFDPEKFFQDLQRKRDTDAAAEVASEGAASEDSGQQD
ncbi:hypothetical protein G7Y31_08275 [Corynebacterium lizhenjunii]|uniref:Uncharacterized protein n=1 Tax=Corynebacterium lizhenjunii TaxID=2709394 RepID=A0A7T0KEA7_9CORY|nr:hypothetical protein [Corynebacterium lizhenjunii]QPK78549.1 hypothetical protein G7Y31_08275 [Corynebacterium lizhenjunii]